MNTYNTGSSSLHTSIALYSRPIATPINNHPPETLGFWTCYLLDLSAPLPLNPISPPEANSNKSFKCFLRAKSFSQDDIVSSAIHRVLVSLIVIMGVVGVTANVANILVLKRTPTARKAYSFRKLLVILAGFDLMACLCAILTVTLLQLIKDNVSRNKGTFLAFKSFFLLYSLGRTASTLFTILLALERYFVMAHNQRTKLWLNSRRRKILLLSSLVLIGVINLPWWLNSVVVPLKIHSRSEGPLAKFPSIFVTTYFGSAIYFSMWVRPVHVFIDFVLPIPLLLLFNGLLYRFIYNWRKNRHNLTGKRVQNLQTAKMFSVVTLILFCCHAVGLVDFIVTEVSGIVYRELILFNIFSITVNASLNFFVYYAFGREFRDCFWLLLPFRKLTGRPALDGIINGTPTTLSPDGLQFDSGTGSVHYKTGSGTNNEQIPVKEANSNPEHLDNQTNSSLKLSSSLAKLSLEQENQCLTMIN